MANTLSKHEERLTQISEQFNELRKDRAEANTREKCLEMRIYGVENRLYGAPEQRAEPSKARKEPPPHATSQLAYYPKLAHPPHPGSVTPIPRSKSKIKTQDYLDKVLRDERLSQLGYPAPMPHNHSSIVSNDRSHNSLRPPSNHFGNNRKTSHQVPRLVPINGPEMSSIELAELGQPRHHSHLAYHERSRPAVHQTHR